jgi:hypothetical protein
MTMTQLLHGYTPLHFNRQFITEAISKGGPVVLRDVVLQRANAKNQNGRIYPLSILQREAQKYTDFIRDRRALGELDHPDSPVVNLKNVSHNITEMHFDGENLMGTLEILSTPSGNILKELLKNDIRLGVSSRGLGSIKELGEDTVEVQEDFSLICFDVVSNPSTQGAFINESIIPTKRNPWARVDTLIHDFLVEIR